MVRCQDILLMTLDVNGVALGYTAKTYGAAGIAIGFNFLCK